MLATGKENEGEARVKINQLSTEGYGQAFSKKVLKIDKRGDP